MDLDQESTMFEKATMGIPYNGSRIEYAISSNYGKRRE